MPTVGLPLGIVLTCQATELAAFCTSAGKCIWSPVKACAEEGDTVTLTVSATGGGALEDTRPPQEIKNVSRGERKKRSKRSNHNARGCLISRRC